MLAALLKIGWSIKRERGTSHKVLERKGWPDFVFSFHDNEEIRTLSAVSLAVAVLPPLGGKRK